MRKNQPRRKRRRSEIKEKSGKCACRKPAYKVFKREGSNPTCQLREGLRLHPLDLAMSRSLIIGHD